MLNYMLRFFILSVLICNFWGCSKEDTGATYNKTYITGYLNPETILISNIDSGIELTLEGSVITSGKTFNTLSKVYNDLSYNRYTVCGPRIAINEDIHEIKIETVDNFDSSHPAGSDISELIECSYISYYDYIQSGYKKEEKDVEQYSDLMAYFGIEGAKLLKNKLLNLNSTNTKLVSQNFVLKFNKKPKNKGIYKFKLVLQMSEKRIEIFFEYDFNA